MAAEYDNLVLQIPYYINLKPFNREKETKNIILNEPVILTLYLARPVCRISLQSPTTEHNIEQFSLE